MLNFVKLKGDENNVNDLFGQELSEQSEEMLQVLGVMNEFGVNEFDFTFSQLSQVNKADPFSGASIKLKFDVDDLIVSPEVFEEILIGELGDNNFQGMMVELGNGDVFLKIGYRDLPFADRGEDPGPGPDELVEQALTDLSLDLF